MNDDLQTIADYLKTHQIKIVTAESVTTGLIASKLAELPGAGQWLDSSFVSYSEDAKKQWLDVDEGLMDRFGLKSEEVAQAMAAGALKAANANLAIASTGIAGPSGDNGKEEVGTVCFAWLFGTATNARSFSEKAHFDGDRNEIRDRAAVYALQRIARYHGSLQAP
ncbi:MAG: CinA family protein [Burkholderiaceae bacterium]